MRTHNTDACLQDLEHQMQALKMGLTDGEDIPEPEQNELEQDELEQDEGAAARQAPQGGSNVGTAKELEEAKVEGVHGGASHKDVGRNFSFGISKIGPRCVLLCFCRIDDVCGRLWMMREGHESGLNCLSLGLYWVFVCMLWYCV